MNKLSIFFLVIYGSIFFAFSQEVNYSIRENETIMLKNGAILTHDLYLSKSEDSAASILIRTPYGKEGIRKFASYFAKNGFNVIVQDVRGKNASKGVFVPFINEKKDGLETVNWMTKQSWCNGNIGLWGSSYLGYSALILSDSKHPAIKSIFNLSGWIDGTDVNYPGDAFHQMLIIPWLLSDGRTSKLSENGADMDEMFAHIPLREAIPREGTFISASGKLISIDNLDVPFNYEKVDIPTFHMTGWYDFTNSATIDAFQNISKNNEAHHYALLGPWYHNQVYDEYNSIGDYKLPESEFFTIDKFLALATQWFNHTLNDASFNFGSNNPIKYYILFANQWKYADQWPPEHTTASLFLNGEGQLIESKSSSNTEKSNYTFNPIDPTPTVGGSNFNLFTDYVGIKNQEELEKRNDVLSFTSKPFLDDTTIAGNIKIELYVSTTGKSTDFTAKITLVNNNNESLNITDQIVRLKPNQLNKAVNKVIITLPDTAFEVKKGEKIRLQISSSNYPKFNRNPNTGENPLDAIEFVSVKQSIYHSNQYPSKINIPILKN